MQFGPAFVLFVVFLILKLTHVIAWSWWWVTSPLWITGVLSILVLGLAAVGVTVFHRKAKKRAWY